MPRKAAISTKKKVPHVVKITITVRDNADCSSAQLNLACKFDPPVKGNAIPNAAALQTAIKLIEVVGECAKGDL